MSPESEPILSRVRRDLRENVLTFWTRDSWDEEHGGFLSYLQERGQRSPITDKYIRIQTRMIWTLSAAHRHGIEDCGYLELAGKGFRYLIDRMWDNQYEGFYGALRQNGTPFLTWKWVYAQSFAIYALSEYFLASGNEEALFWARRTFDLIKRKALCANGGWREFFTREWKARLRWKNQYTTDNHLHLLESFTILQQATADPEHVDAVSSIIDLLRTKIIQNGTLAVEKYTLDWHPKRGIDLQVTTSYGHDGELAWLLAFACRMIGMPASNYIEQVQQLVDYVLEHGFDHERGGIAFYGAPGKHVLESWRLRKRRNLRGWWQQAEMLTALILVYELTHDPNYLSAFSRQFDWVWNRQIDHEGGEWHGWVTWPDGFPLNYPKGGNDHKCCYHNGRALMMCEKALERLGLEEWTGTGY
ncbi:MAG: AGE family epimerase/isomerase [Verrucomicrobia bacterium]|nr:AGE family epimerase/isomerase [Verrucomicrobiota bacterium]